MSFRGLRVQQWEARLKEVFDQIDHELEDRYSGRFNLHPTRPPRGSTSDPEADGLVNVGAAFTAGYGSRTGRGYVVEIRLAAAGRIPADVEQAIEAEVERRLRDLLPAAFPERALNVTRDGHVLKIVGDLSL